MKIIFIILLSLIQINDGFSPRIYKSKSVLNIEFSQIKDKNEVRT